MARNKKKYNKFFETLVDDEYDIVGMIAYAHYKFKKREKIREKEKELKRELNRDEIEHISKNLFDRDMIGLFFDKAKQSLDAAVDINKYLNNIEMNDNNNPLEETKPDYLSYIPKKLRPLVAFIAIILGTGGGGYLIYSKNNQPQEVPQKNAPKCDSISVIGEIDNKFQKKIKSVSLLEFTYAEDRDVVEGKFELKNINNLNSSQITLIVKYEGRKDEKISVPLKNFLVNKDCQLDIGKQHAL